MNVRNSHIFKRSLKWILRKLKTLIDLVAESGISELEVTEENDKVRIVNKVQTVAVAAAPVAAPVVTAPAPVQRLPLKNRLRPLNPQLPEQP